MFFFFFYCSRPLRDLHSFPTRRSSDLRTTSCVVSTLWSAVGDFCHPCSWTCGSRGRFAPVSFRTTRLNPDRKSTRLNSSHVSISYAVFCLKKKKKQK